MADQDSVVWAERFEVALERLVGRRLAASLPEGMRAAGAQPGDAEAAQAATAAPAMSAQMRQLINDAVSAFTQYKQNLADNNFGAAGNSLEELNSLLQQIEEQTGGQTTGEGTDGAGEPAAAGAGTNGS
jgi:hypothetical protein